MKLDAISNKIKSSLTESEFNHLVESLRKDASQLLDKLVPPPEVETESFVEGISVFLGYRLQVDDADTLINENIIKGYREFNGFCETISSFPVLKMKDVLIQLLNYSDNPVYDYMVSEFIISLRSSLSDDDFDFLLEDEALSNLYN